MAEADLSTSGQHFVETIARSGVDVIELAESLADSATVLGSLAAAGGPVELAESAVSAADLWTALESLGLVVEPAGG